MAHLGWFFELSMSTIYLLSSIAFIYFGANAAKRNDRIAMILCLLLTLSCIMFTFEYFCELTTGRSF